jgi:pilus assembly protein CpaE
MTRVLLAINEQRLADHLTGLVSESDDLELAGSLRGPQELRGALPRSDVDAVVVYDRQGTPPLIEITRELTTAHPDVGLVLIVESASPEHLRGGMQAGARDVIAEPIGLDELETSVMAAAAWSQAFRRRAAREAGTELVGLGRVITVVGAKGGVGTTTIATHLGLAARELDDTSVSVVEYDLHAGDLRAFLDLPYGRGVVDLAPVAEELTSRHLQETMYAHATGIRVLLGPEEGERAEEVTGTAARNILTAIRTRSDLTIVDAGATMNDATSVAVEIADSVIVVTTPDVVALRGVTRLYSLWSRLRIEPAEVVVLLNRLSRKLEVQPDLVRRVVPVPVLETAVPADFFALESSLNTGISSAGAASDTMLRPMAAVLGELSALPSEADQRDGDRRRTIVARLAKEEGQATIEVTGLLPILVVVMLALAQIALIGLTFVFTGNAARSGARAYAVGQSPKDAALKHLPSYFSERSEVTASTDSHGYGSVDVKVDVPSLIPGVSLPFDIDSHSGTVIEDQLVPGQQPLLGPPVGGGGGAGVVKPLQPPQVTQLDHGTILPDGDATVPASAPPAVKLMVEAANSIDQTPYPDPVQHYGSLAVPWPAYDCSGSTSYVLFRAGLLPDGNYVSGDFTSQHEYGFVPGPGKYVTIYARPGSGEEGHVHIVIDGVDFDTDGPQDGPRWYYPGQSYPDTAYPYAQSHPPGL